MPNPKPPKHLEHPNHESRPGYEYLADYRLGVVIQELTEEFTERWIESFRRKSQMDEAARSNPQCVAEGYTQASLKGYIKLTGIARGSNEELTKDYVHFLKKEGLPIWPKDHPKVRGFRAFRAVWVSRNTLNTPNLPKDKTEAANILLTFCQMEGYLLRKHVAALERKHETEGGLTEKLYWRRIAYRSQRENP